MMNIAKRRFDVMYIFMLALPWTLSGFIVMPVIRQYTVLFKLKKKVKLVYSPVIYNKISQL